MKIIRIIGSVAFIVAILLKLVFASNFLGILSFRTIENLFLGITIFGFTMLVIFLLTQKREDRERQTHVFLILNVIGLFLVGIGLLCTIAHWIFFDSLFLIFGCLVSGFSFLIESGEGPKPNNDQLIDLE